MPSAKSSAARMTSPWLTTSTLPSRWVWRKSKRALTHALTARHGGDAAAIAPHLPALVRPDRIKGQTGPFAEIELEQILAILDRHGEPVRKDLGGLVRALQRARIDRIDHFPGETFR